MQMFQQINSRFRPLSRRIWKQELAREDNGAESASS